MVRHRDALSLYPPADYTHARLRSIDEVFFFILLKVLDLVNSIEAWSGLRSRKPERNANAVAPPVKSF